MSKPKTSLTNRIPNYTALRRLKSVHSKKFKWLDAKMKARNWSIQDGMQLYDFPFWLLHRVYSKIDRIDYYGKHTKGRILYRYIPAVYTIDKIPIIIHIDLVPGDVPKRAKVMSYVELKQVFKNNKYQD